MDSSVQLLNNWGLASVVQRQDSAIHRINLYPVDSTIGFPNTYPLKGDLSGGQHYPTFEQWGKFSTRAKHNHNKFTARVSDKKPQEKF